MSKQKAVHYRLVPGEYTVCGRNIGYRRADNGEATFKLDFVGFLGWNEVTCKNCLKWQERQKQRRQQTKQNG